MPIIRAKRVSTSSPSKQFQQESSVVDSYDPVASELSAERRWKIAAEEYKRWRKEEIFPQDSASQARRRSPSPSTSGSRSPSSFPSSSPISSQTSDGSKSLTLENLHLLQNSLFAERVKKLKEVESELKLDRGIKRKLREFEKLKEEELDPMEFGESKDGATGRFVEGRVLTKLKSLERLLLLPTYVNSLPSPFVSSDEVLPPPEQLIRTPSNPAPQRSFVPSFYFPKSVSHRITDPNIIKLRGNSQLEPTEIVADQETEPEEPFKQTQAAVVDMNVERDNEDEDEEMQTVVKQESVLETPPVPRNTPRKRKSLDLIERDDHNLDRKDLRRSDRIKRIKLINYEESQDDESVIEDRPRGKRLVDATSK